MFPGLTAADFDCYEPRKWKSNVFNRERLEVKQKLQALGRELGGELTSSDGSPLHIETSVEHPALWNHKQVDTQSVYFSRHEAARKELDGIIDRQNPISSLLDDPTPQRNHLFLAITLMHESLELSLKLHPDAHVDRQNFERKLEEHYEAERLIGLLSELPSEFLIGITPNVKPLFEASGDGLDADSIRKLVASLPPPSSETAPTSAISFTPFGPPPVPRVFFLGQTLPREEVLGRSTASLLEWAGEGLSALLPIYRFIAWSRDNDFVSMKQVLDKERTSRRQKGLHKNDRVRVIRGMFAGKDGVVQEVDAKGQLKVLVGKVAIKTDAADVEKLA